MVDDQWELVADQMVVFKGTFREAVRLRAAKYSKSRFAISHPTKGSYSGYFSLRLDIMATVLVRRTIKPVTPDGSIKIMRNSCAKKVRTYGKFVLTHHDLETGGSHINMPDCAATVRQHVKKLQDAYGGNADQSHQITNDRRTIKSLGLLVYCVVALDLKWRVPKGGDSFGRYYPFVVDGVDRNIGELLSSPVVTNACNNIEYYDYLEAFLNLAMAAPKSDRLWQISNNRSSFTGMSRTSLYYYIIKHAVPWRVIPSEAHGLPESNINIASDVDATVILLSNEYPAPTFNESLFRSLGDHRPEAPDDDDLVAVRALVDGGSTILAVIQNQIKWWPNVLKNGNMGHEFLIRSTDAVLLIASGEVQSNHVREYHRD